MSPRCGGCRGARFKIRVAFLLMLFCLASDLLGQQAGPDTYAGFDGQTVSGIAIAAASSVETQSVRGLIEQQPGRPFSDDAIRRSVAALQQTGQFTSVKVTIEPQEHGLRVVFVLEPADYIGIVNFVGTGTAIPYTALLQAANIPEQTPFYPALVDDAKNGVTEYLHKLGYFEAQVRTDVNRDSRHDIANVTFVCALHNQAKIRNIEFDGISLEQSNTIRNSLRGIWARLKRVSLKSGQRYTEARATRAIAFIRDHLRKDNRLAPSIRLASVTYEIDSKTVDIKYQVTAGPRVTVEVSGAHVSAKTIRRLVPIYEEGSVDQDLVEEGRGNLTSYFQTKGYFDAMTTSHLEQRGDTVAVVYDVDLGAKHRVTRITFQGNRHFSIKQLATQISIKRGFLFGHGTYSKQLLTKSVTSLTDLYHNDGFSGVSIQPQTADVASRIMVTFLINEGDQDKVASLQVRGNQTQNLAELYRRYRLRLQPGSAFSPRTLETDRSQLLATYLNLGYLNARVRTSASPTASGSHEINVTFDVDEGPQARISQVSVLGSEHTHPPFIEAVTQPEVSPGQPQSEGGFLQAETNLYNLGIFDWASIKSVRPITDQTEEQTLIKVHESPLHTMDIGGGLEIIPRDANVPVNAVAVPGIPPVSLGNKFTVSQRSLVSPRFTFDFARHDLRGRAETATIGAVVSRLDQRAFFTYADPRLSGPWSSLFSLSAERTTQNPIYAAVLGNASFQTERALDPRRTKRVVFRYSFQRTDLSNILIPGLVLPQDQHVRISTVEGEFLRDTRDKPLDAHRGVYQTADFGITARPLGASADFVRFLGQSAFYRQVKPWLVWANNLRLGFAQPFSGSRVPLSEEFFSGGADSLRGFPINGAGPQRPLPVCSNTSNTATCSLISVPVGGNTLFIFNSEARFPLPILLKQSLGGVVFYDGGNVYSNFSFRQFADNFTHSVGLGLRYQTPVGPVRFDVAYRLTPIPGVKAIQYFVTLGQSF